MKDSTIPSNNPVSRRNFLQTTSVAAGGALLTGLSVERMAHAASDDTIKIALIGCGGRGSGAAQPGAVHKRKHQAGRNG